MGTIGDVTKEQQAPAWTAFCPDMEGIASAGIEAQVRTSACEDRIGERHVLGLNQLRRSDGIRREVGGIDTPRAAHRRGNTRPAPAQGPVHIPIGKVGIGSGRAIDRDGIPPTDSGVIDATLDLAFATGLQGAALEEGQIPIAQAAPDRVVLSIRGVGEHQEAPAWPGFGPEVPGVAAGRIEGQIRASAGERQVMEGEVGGGAEETKRTIPIVGKTPIGNFKLLTRRH